MAGQGGAKVIIIKKKAKPHGHHGGAWKVAYADFVTAMMALFIVLWLLTQSDEASKERISHYFRTGMLPGGSLTFGDPSGSSPPVPVNIFSEGSTGGPQITQADRELARGLEALIRDAKNDPDLQNLAGHLKVQVTPEGTLIELVDGDDNFLFSVGSSGLKIGAVKLLRQLGPILGRIRNKLEIHGHSDSRPFESSSKMDNWSLSFERADEARRVLENNGVPPGRIFAVQAHADTQPLNRRNPLSAENRRLALLIVKNKTKRKKAQAADAHGAAGTEPARPDSHTSTSDGEP